MTARVAKADPFRSGSIKLCRTATDHTAASARACRRVCRKLAVEAPDRLRSICAWRHPLPSHLPVAVDAARLEVLSKQGVAVAFRRAVVVGPTLAAAVAVVLAALVAEVCPAEADHGVAPLGPSDPKRACRALLRKLLEHRKQLRVVCNLCCPRSKVPVQQVVHPLDVRRRNPCNVVREQGARAVRVWASDVRVSLRNARGYPAYQALAAEAVVANALVPPLLGVPLCNGGNVRRCIDAHGAHRRFRPARCFLPRAARRVARVAEAGPFVRVPEPAVRLIKLHGLQAVAAAPLALRMGNGVELRLNMVNDAVKPSMR